MEGFVQEILVPQPRREWLLRLRSAWFAFLSGVAIVFIGVTFCAAILLAHLGLSWLNTFSIIYGAMACLGLEILAVTYGVHRQILHNRKDNK